MFGRRYFGGRYFGPRHFGPQGTVAPSEPVTVIGADDAIGELCICEDTIGGPRAEPWPAGLDHAVWINGSIAGAVQLGQVSCQRDVGQRGTARITMLRTPDLPTEVPDIGSKVEISWRDHLQWGGMVENVRIRTQAGTVGLVWWYELECASWDRLAEKRMTALAYTDTTTKEIFEDVLDRVLNDEGVTAGIIDEGVTLSLAGPQQENQPTRVSDFLRDVAEASGGVSEIDPFRRLHFRKLTVRKAGRTLTNVIAIESVTSNIERQDYRNAQTVKVTGTDGAVVYVLRESASEINARQAIERGSGRYEATIEVSHPTSNDEIELQRLGIGLAVTLLNTYGRHARKVQVQINKPSYRIGDVVTLEFPEHGISGAWQIAGMKFRAVAETLRVDLDLYQTSVLQRAYQSWLKLTNVGKSVAVVKDMPLFQQEVTFTHDATWTVPDAYGDGSAVEVEVEAVASGGGGGGGAQLLNSNCTPSSSTSGGNGGRGGRATSFRTLLPGTVITIAFEGGFVAGGAAGNSGAYYQFFADQAGNACGITPATSGGDGRGVTVTHNERLDPTLICSATGGKKGTAVSIQYNGTGPDDFGALLSGSNGADGTALGDFISANDGGQGGQFTAFHYPASPAKLGADGRVTIRW